MFYSIQHIISFIAHKLFSFGESSLNKREKDRDRYREKKKRSVLYFSFFCTISISFMVSSLIHTDAKKKSSIYP